VYFRLETCLVSMMRWMGAQARDLPRVDDALDGCPPPCRQYSRRCRSRCWRLQRFPSQETGGGRGRAAAAARAADTQGTGAPNTTYSRSTGISGSRWGAALQLAPWPGSPSPSCWWVSPARAPGWAARAPVHLVCLLILARLLNLETRRRAVLWVSLPRAPG
jgi:hypothetical protein